MNDNIQHLQAVATQIRRDVVEMVAAAGSGHPGGSLSAADIMACLYFQVMHIDPKNPRMAERDRFVLSKGHGAPVLYAALAERGYFDRSELKALRRMGAMLQGHPDMKGIPGVDMSTGSLGQGISAAVGMALAAKLDNAPRHTYVLLGDGELNEGLVWEAAMAAAHYKLENLIGILDYNGLQIDGANEAVMGITPVDEKFKSFGWHVLPVDGHDLPALLEAFEAAKAHEGGPVLILAHTVKGKGVSFMENQAGWHGKAPSAEELAKALEELQGGLYA